MEVNKENFEELVLNAGMPALVTFKAAWCGPCKMLTPTIDQLTEEYEGKAVIVKIDVDEHSDLATSYAVRSIPAILFFKDGELVDRLTGNTPKPQLASKLDNLIG